MIIVYVANDLPESTFKKVEEMIANESLCLPWLSSIEVKVKRRDFTYVDSDDSLKSSILYGMVCSVISKATDS